MPCQLAIVNFLNMAGVGRSNHSFHIAKLPCDASGTTRLSGLHCGELLRDLKWRRIKQPCLVVHASALRNHERYEGMEPKSARELFAAKSWEELVTQKYSFLVLSREFGKVFPDTISGVRHEIDLVLGSKCCVKQQWPLPRDQGEAIHAFFKGRRKAGHVRKNTFPHSSPTFCVKMARSARRISHAFTKLNEATIPA